ncbi:YaaC family protein [Virgibacillus ainsalahensis]
MKFQSFDAFYTNLQNLQTSQNYLKNCYRLLPNIDAESKSFENSATFMYYLEHGQLFLKEGEEVDVRLKPILYFYGMVHLLKACLLTRRPDYPESTAILAHGVTARKRKKKQYSFFLDEVKIQQNGLFTYTYQHLFASKHPPFTKVKMDILLELIPEMNDFFLWQKKEKSVEVGEVGRTTLNFPLDLLDSYHLTEKAFINRISHYLPPIKNTGKTKKYLVIKLEKSIGTSSIGPFYFHLLKQKIYFPYDRGHFVQIPEIMIHYLLLYNLSMISRYETEYWGELFSTKYGQDYSIIFHYLTVAAEKIPILLGNLLIERASLY